MRISLIAAMSMPERVIGVNNSLPWHLSADLQRFKALTIDKSVIMGRKTYQSIGKPLPKRTNIVVTRDTAFDAPGCVLAHSLEEAIAQAEPADEVMIMGGADLYQQALPRADRLYLTLIQQAFTGDAFFPAWEEAYDWIEVAREDHVDDEHSFAFSFLTLDKNYANNLDEEVDEDVQGNTENLVAKA